MEYSLLLGAGVGVVGAAIAIVAFSIGMRSARSPAIRRQPEEDSKSAADSLVDPATGLASRPAWNEILRREEDRFARYGRPVTVMVMELDGLDKFAVTFGEGTADRLIPPVAMALRRNARGADVFARTGHTRFTGLLPETDEVAATNYVERMRAECDSWLEGGSLAVRLAVGWAQPKVGGYLTDALSVAEDRMNADRRRTDFRAVPAGRPAATREEKPPRPLVAIR